MSVMDMVADMHKATFEIKVKVLDGGLMPMKAHTTDAGFDLYATEDITIYPGQVIKHPLKVCFQFPPGAWGRVESKSGLGSKGLLVYAGVIDEGYRGEVHAVMSNIKLRDEVDGNIVMLDKPIVIRKGEKVAQMTINPHSNEYYMVRVDNIETNTDRGVGGFGSSGAV